VFNRHGYSLANLLLVVDSVWKKVTRKAYIKISRLEFTGEVNTFYGFAGGQTNQDYCRFQWLTGKEPADQIKDMVDVIYTMSNK
jgi:hypothetical protein